MSRMLLSLAAVTLGWLGAGCSDSSASAAQNSPAALQSHSSPGILLRMQSAPTQTKFSGERLLWMRAEAQGANQTLSYTETIYADGLGGFSIEPGHVVQPNLAQGQQDLFEILQRTREGFLFRYRDFAVRDLALLEQNYFVQDLGTSVTIAGRTCQELRFERRLLPARVYVVAVDQVTGLVLRWEERNEAGLPMARMEYTSFDPAPSLIGVTMHADLASTPLDPMTDNKGLLGFPLRLPGVVHGFQIVEANSVVYDGRTWARVQYQDGIEPLLYLYSHRSAIPSGRLLARPDDPESLSVVRIYKAGAWTVAECSRAGSKFIVAGKLDESRLVETLQSAVE